MSGGIPDKGTRYVLFRLLDIGNTNVGADKEWYRFVPCLVSWKLLRDNYVVLWLNSLGWRRLVYYSRL